MPKKKAEPEAVVETEQIDASIPDVPKVVKEVKASLCGHVNRHSQGLDRKLDNMTCDLPSGHAGDHSGMHQEYEKQYETTVENGVEKTRVILVAVEKRGWWGEMAGIPVSQIPKPKPREAPTVATLEKRLRALEDQPVAPDKFINQ